MITLTVSPPHKTDTLYRFECAVTKAPNFVFGFKAENYKLKHHWVWDSLYPAMALLFATTPIIAGRHTRAEVVFKYPVHEALPQTLKTIGKNKGVDLIVEAKTFAKKADLEMSGVALPFGGGKDSRLLLGMLRELGETPIVSHCRHEMSPRISDVPLMTSIGLPMRRGGRDWLLPNRIMPAFMKCPETLFYGASFNFLSQERLWHQYSDLSGAGVHIYQNLLRDMGVGMSLSIPLSVLPENMAQHILCHRYPRLARHQWSTPSEAPTEKNLHVSLCKLLHGIPFQDHCSWRLFGALVQRFIKDQAGSCPDGDGRRLFHLEMRAILHRRQVDIGVEVPDEWAAEWIYHLHEHVCQCRAQLLSIFREYATPWQAGAALD